MLNLDVGRLAVAAAVAVAMFLGGMAAHKLFADRKFAKLESACAEQRSTWNKLVAEAQSTARAREAELQSAVDKSRQEAADAVESIRQQGALLAVARTDLDLLRKRAAAYAAGRGPEDSVAACQARADRLGALLADGAGLLDEGRELAAACGIRADERAVKLSACVNGWPK